MKFFPHGAVGGEVTGSAYLVETDKARVVLTHGEDTPRSELAKRLQRDFSIKCQLPAIAEVIEA